MTFEEIHYAHTPDEPGLGPEFQAGPHGWLGANLQPSNPPYTPRGVGIVSVVPGGPADRAGIHAGDRILSLDHEELASVAHLLDLLSRTDPGEEVELLVLSHGYDVPVTTVLEDYSVFNFAAPVGHWYHAGYPTSGHWHAFSDSGHDELLAQQRRLVERQERIESMLLQIQADLTSIERELHAQPTSGTIEEVDLE